MVNKQFYGNTTLVKREWVEELQLEYIEVKENRLGSSIVHLKTDDPENLFCIALRTYPSSSNGVAHILEHTVLCGSKKYPVADPFFSMIRRSLATFMNAFTGQDFTCYPASSMVKKDFYNLLDVYLDAVFFPDLDKLSFFQEGFRLSAEDMHNPQSTIRMDGVVFNEMKGSFSSPQTRLMHHMNSHLFKDSTYHYVSGGDPAVIPNITYEDLKAFHQKYYHPSQALFYFYGNGETEEHLEYLDKRLFSHSTAAPIIAPLGNEPKKNKPEEARYPYPSNEETLKEGYYLSLGYLTCSIEQTTEAIALQLCDALLMGHDGSVLRSAILESGYCSHCYSLIDIEMKQNPWVFIAEGCKKEDLPALEKLFHDQIKHWCQHPFPKDQIDTQLHQMMLETLEITDHGLTYGLSLFFRSMLLKMHGQDPLKGLKVRKSIEMLRKKVEKDPLYLSTILERWTLHNTHKTTLVLEPSTDLENEENTKEKQLLKKMVDQLTHEDRISITNTQQALLKKQQTVQDLSVLPKVHVTDIQASPTHYPLIQEDNVYTHECFTNGFGYVTYAFNLPNLSLEEMPWFYLYTQFLFELGTKNTQWKERVEKWQRYTGGASCYWTPNISIEENAPFNPLFCLESRALDENLPTLLYLLKESVEETNFDDLQRIDMLFDQYYLSLINSTNKSPLPYIISMTKSNFSSVQVLQEHYKGSTMLNALRSLKLRPDKAAFLSDCFKRFHTVLFSSTPELCFTGSGQSSKFFKDNPLCTKNTPQSPMSLPSPLSLNSQIKEIVSHVAVNSVSMPSCGLSSPHAPAMSLLSFLLENTFLHTQIREQGGAYHVRAEYNHLQQIFTLYSGQDPHISRTKEKFDETPQYLQEHRYTDQEIEEAKLRFFQTVDSPLSPGQRGDASFFQLKHGLTLDKRKKFRKAVLNTTTKEILKAVEHIYIPNYKNSIYIGACSPEKYKNDKCILPISRF